jgi:hypothetical protein
VGRSWCSRAAACASYHRTLEQGSAETSGGNRSLYDAQEAEATAHLQAFLKHWTRLLSLERAAATQGRDALWNSSGAARERKGGCVSGLVLCSASYVQPDGMDLEDTEHLQRRMLYTFRREVEAAGEGLRAFTELGSGFAQGAHLLLSTDCGLVVVARVVVHELRPDRLVLATKRQLKLPPGA